jgi:hypothetical protein
LGRGQHGADSLHRHCKKEGNDVDTAHSANRIYPMSSSCGARICPPLSSL